jgi:hypothetical protein
MGFRRSEPKRIEARLRNDVWRVTIFQPLGCQLYHRIDARTGEGGSIGAGCP